MSENRKRSVSARQKRVQSLKRMIILTMLILILLPTMCCVALMVQVRDLNRRIDEVEERLEQADKLQKVSDSAVDSEMLYASVGQGSIPEAGALLTQMPDGDDVGEQEQEDTLRKVYLTFDDGPSIYTDEILDILAEYDVKGTFFVVGKEDENSKEAIQRITQEGHTLGMHSYSHKYSELYASMENFEADFKKQRTYLEELTGEECKFYRFPGGSSNTVSRVDMQQLADYLDSQDVMFFDWNISSGDGGGQLLDVDTLVKNSTDDLEKWRTVVILMHDSAEKPTTVDALPQIIEKILAMEDTVILPITEETDTLPVQHILREKQ